VDDHFKHISLDRPIFRLTRSATMYVSLCGSAMCLVTALAAINLFIHSSFWKSIAKSLISSKSLRIGDVLGDGSSRFFFIYLLLIPENMYKSLAMCYLAPMTSSKPCGTMQLFLQLFLSTNISKGSLAARIWRWACLLSLFFSCTGRQFLLVQEKTVWFFWVLWIIGFIIEV